MLRLISPLKRHITYPHILSATRLRRLHLSTHLCNDTPKIEIINPADAITNQAGSGSEEPSTVLDIADETDDIMSDNKIVYVDTMKVYNELRELGYTEKQSDIILRLIKETVTSSLDKLQSKILTEMELENESYLFEAATSELKTETVTSREADLRNLEMDKYALERLMQLESDELNEYLIMSKNDSQVTINDQISENTLLQKRIKMKIQDLDNKISTKVNSDIKSEIESLRWHTTRSGLMAVLVLVFSVMAGVSINKKINKEEQPQQVILRMVEPETFDGSEEEELEKEPLENNDDILDLELKKKHDE